ncbi:MAG: methyltransferase domain-containing protein [Bacteroidales bacterium]|nr:methyltransferase domain-containing protein [Bacteroidales bacterium]
MICRNCHTVLKKVFVDLVSSPPSNAMLKPRKAGEPEVFYPLKVYICHHCYLVQVDEIKKAEEIFNPEYTYFSSFSSSWLAHAKEYTEMMINRFGFNEKSLVIEIASNDGYLLQYFKEHNIPVLGIDPAADTAEAAIKKGIPTIIDFFGYQLAQKQLVNKGMKGDLLIGNNVLAHVPDINDFVAGLKLALKDDGIITMEFPHLMQLVQENQFDTIYHEHFSYLSFFVVKQIFEKHGLEMFDVEEISTHGGSLRIFAKHVQDESKKISPNVGKLIEKEEKAGMKKLDYYKNFQEKVNHIKYEFLEFLLEAKKEGKKVIGFGAAAKGNTFLNYCGIRGNDMIEFVADSSPYKQRKLLPASHIAVKSPDCIKDQKPDYVIIFPWNLKKEISESLSYIREWGGKFVTFIPKTEIF